MALIHSPIFTCLSYRIKKRKKATTFKLIKLLKHTQKHAVTTEDRILIRHYRLDKNIEPENMPPNNPDLNPADYSILENLSQLRLYIACSLAVSTQDSPAVEPRSNPGSGKILMSENLRLYTTSPVVMC